MSTQGEPSGAVVGHEEGLTEAEQAVIEAFVGMVRRGEIPLEQRGLGEANEGRKVSTEEKGPFEDDAEEKEGNGSLKLEILHGITAGGDGNEPVRRVTKVGASSMAGMRALSGNKRANDDEDARSQLSLPDS